MLVKTLSKYFPTAIITVIISNNTVQMILLIEFEIFSNLLLNIRIYNDFKIGA